MNSQISDDGCQQLFATSCPPFLYDPPSDDIDIIHQDQDLLVVNKPAGLLTVPGKHEDHAHCLLSRVEAMDRQALLTHRLDMDTSGVIVFARNSHAQRHISLQFERRHAQKRYEALVYGAPPAPQGEISLPLRCDWPNRPLQMVDYHVGRVAQTGFEHIGYSDFMGSMVSRLALFPKTGRSHQLRVHCVAMGCPIIGDRFYAQDQLAAGGDYLGRMALHAAELTLFHPTGGATRRFVVAPPF